MGDLYRSGQREVIRGGVQSVTQSSVQCAVCRVQCAVYSVQCVVLSVNRCICFPASIPLSEDQELLLLLLLIYS